MSGAFILEENRVEPVADRVRQCIGPFLVDGSIHWLTVSSAFMLEENRVEPVADRVRQ